MRLQGFHRHHGGSSQCSIIHPDTEDGILIEILVTSQEENVLTLLRSLECFLHQRIPILIDGINKGEDPFGYGIRADGKIYYGARATEWMNKKIQKND